LKNPGSASLVQVKKGKFRHFQWEGKEKKDLEEKIRGECSQHQTQFYIPKKEKRKGEKRIEGKKVAGSRKRKKKKSDKRERTRKERISIKIVAKERNPIFLYNEEKK